MLKKLNKHTKTIKGRTTLLVASFLIILLSFSTYVYFQAREIKRDYHTYKTKWQAVQLQLFIEALNMTSLKVFFYEAIYTQNLDTLKFIGNFANESISSNTRFKNKLDSIQADFNYKEPVTKLLQTKYEMYQTLMKLHKRIYELNTSNQKNSIITDSVIKQTFYPKFESLASSFWSDFFGKVVNEVDTRAEKLALEIKNRTIRLVATVVIFSIILSIFYIFLWYKFIKSLSNSIRKPIMVLEKLADGELVTESEQTENELSTVIDATLKLSKNLKKASDFSIEIGKGNFDYEFNAISEKDELGSSLILMRNELKTYAEKEKEINWSNIGLAKFALILRKTDQSLEDISYNLLSELIKYLNANQGGIFIFDSESKKLKMTACYAYDRKKFLEKEIEIGEGLVGQCYVEADKMYLTEVPQDYIHITSGLGFNTPTSLLLIPVKTNEQVLGVLELASFKDFKDFEIDFIEKIAENIAVVITNISKNELTKKLLQESTFATENMKAQEEEMRQNLEELFATQEEMKRRESTLQTEIENLKASLAKYE